MLSSEGQRCSRDALVLNVRQFIQYDTLKGDLYSINNACRDLLTNESSKLKWVFIQPNVVIQRNSLLFQTY